MDARILSKSLDNVNGNSKDNINNSNNVNVKDNNIYNVNVEELIKKVQERVDRPNAIGESFARALGAPQNLRLYVKLARDYPQDLLFECLALTKDAALRGVIKTSPAQYFWGIFRNKQKGGEQ